MSEAPQPADTFSLNGEDDPDAEFYRSVANVSESIISDARGSAIVDIGEWDPKMIIQYLTHAIHFSVADVMSDKDQDVRPTKNQTLVMTGYSSAFAGSRSLEERIQYSFRSKVNQSHCRSIVLSHGAPNPYIFNKSLPWYQGPFQHHWYFSLSAPKPSALQLSQFKLQTELLPKLPWKWKQIAQTETIPLR